jgi:anaerobic magnesium-protoporphyrin IX monomethyl ester cyclase
LASNEYGNPRFLLAFPPQQVTAEETIRPDGMRALPYLDAALGKAGFDSDILDMSIGTPTDRLEDTFYRQVQISERFTRIGISPEQLLDVVADYDVVALTSIFTQQTSRCLEVGSLVKEAFPEKLLVAGGANARSLREHFLDHGFDAIFLSERGVPSLQPHEIPSAALQLEVIAMWH